MPDSPKVSVIVPVYNPGRMIHRGLNSLQRQTLRDIEIILVNDASREETLIDIRSASADDPRIRILDIATNSGAGNARNIGIENADGEYLAFMDADDFVAPDFLDRLYKKAKLYQADIAKGSLISVQENGVKNRVQPSAGENGKIRAGLKNGKPLYTLFLSGHYSALYKAQWLRDNGLRYGASRFGEDSTFLLRATSNTTRMVLDDRASYYLVDHPDSLMKQLTPERLDEQLLALREQIDYLIGHFGQESNLAYEMLRIQWALGIQAAAVRQGNMAEKADTFLTDIRSEVMRLPNLPRLVLRSPMIGALIEYRENLCSIVLHRVESTSEEDVLVESVTRCFRFASQHPERKDLYGAPLQESLERAGAYLCRWNGTAANLKVVKAKAVFLRKIVCTLRMNERLSSSMLCESSKAAISKAVKK